MHEAITTLTEEVKRIATIVDNQNPTRRQTNPSTAPTDNGLDASIHNPRTYAHAASAPAQQPPRQENANKAPTNPNKAHHPCRLVITFNEPVPKDIRRNEIEIVRDINSHLITRGAPTHLKIIAVKWNPQGNCIAFTRSDQNTAAIIPFAEGLPNIIVPGRSGHAKEDKKWFKVEISGVRTGTFDLGGIFSPQTIHDHLCEANPEYAALNVVLKPRWVRPESELANQAYSSVVFAVDSFDQHARLLRTNETLAAFGRLPPRTGLEVALRADIAQDRDIQILNVSITGKPTTTIVNIYNDRNRREERATARLRRTALPTNQPVVITGDWNMHHHMWSTSNNIPAEPETDYTVEWLTANGFLLANTPGKHTYIPHSTRGSPSIIDLTFANGPAIQLAIPFEWSIDPELTFDSDHQAIRWTLFNNINPIDNSCGTRFNIKDTDQEEWGKALEDNLRMFTQPLNVLMNTNHRITTEELEDAASALTMAIAQTNEKAAKVRNPCPT
ncbi:hypothetical protein P691DRAFT_738773, partial [Macrolepiota fuliginosa MF-IS2]